jgi:hypothetical protein
MALYWTLCNPSLPVQPLLDRIELEPESSTEGSDSLTADSPIKIGHQTPEQKTGSNIPENFVVNVISGRAKDGENRKNRPSSSTE